ncbi:MAG: MOP flippase family protein [Terriglobia bacterium]
MNLPEHKSASDFGAICSPIGNPGSLRPADSEPSLAGAQSMASNTPRSSASSRRTRSILSSIKWTGVSQVGRQGLQYGTFIVLARALTSEQFGIVAMAMVVVNFLEIFKDLGTSSAIVQRVEVTPRLLSSLFWVNVMVGVVAALAVFALSSMAAWYYREPRVAVILRVMSFGFLISCLSIVHKSLLTRRLGFDVLAKIELTATAAASGVGIFCARGHCGEWSLVWQTMSNSLVGSVCLWMASKWRPSFSFATADVLSVTRYSLNLTGYSVFNYFCRNADTFIIGRFLGASNLGFYTMAYKIMLYPIAAVAGVLGRVLFPFFSRLQNDLVALRRTYLNVVVAIASATFPILIGLWILAKPFVLVVLGQKWAPVAVQLMILCPVGLIQGIDSTTGSIFTSRGRTGWLFAWGVATGILSVTAFLIGVHWGIAGVALAYLVFNLVLTYPGWAIPFSFIKLPVGEVCRHLWIPLRASVAMAACIGAAWILLPQSSSNRATLCFLVPLGFVSYLTVTWLWNKEALRAVILGLRSGVYTE